MNDGTVKIIGVALLLVASALFVSGCTGKTNDPKHEKISLSGSTTVLPLAQAAAEAYMNAHSSADISVSGGGSGAGITAIGQGTVNIGMSSRALKDSEKTLYPDLVVTSICRDAIVMIVHPSNGATAITLSQVKGIYNGTIKNWKDVGGADLSIVVFGRDSASGTREYFQSDIMKSENCTTYMLEKNSNGAVKESVAQTPGAVGYVGLGYMEGGVKALKLDVGGNQIAPSVATVLDKTYPVSRDLYMMTKGPATGLAKAYLDYVLGTAGQKIVQEQGFVPLK